jgi:hypothetical protein
VGCRIAGATRKDCPFPQTGCAALTGIVSIGDMVKHRLEDLELETNVLRDVYNAAR